jgi:hypothetical protein
MFSLQIKITKSLPICDIKQGGKFKNSIHFVSLSENAFGFLLSYDYLKKNPKRRKEILSFKTKEEAEKFTLDQRVIDVIKQYSDSGIEIVPVLF